MASNNQEEKVTSSRRIYDGKILNLRVDTLLAPSGKTFQREIVEHKGAVAMIPMPDADTVILVRQWRPPAQDSLLEIPAGSLDPDEQPDAAASRELGEEINFTAGRMTKLFASFMAPGYSTELIHYYLAQDLSPTQGEPDDDENLEIVTMPLADAISKIDSGEIRDAKSVSGLLYVERMQRAGRLS